MRWVFHSRYSPRTVLASSVLSPAASATARSRRSRNGTTMVSVECLDGRLRGAGPGDVGAVLFHRAVVDAGRTHECCLLQLGGDGGRVARRLLGLPRQHRVDRAHRLVASQCVQDLVLLVGEHPLQLACAGHDDRRQRCVALAEQRVVERLFDRRRLGRRLEHREVLDDRQRHGRIACRPLRRSRRNPLAGPARPRTRRGTRGAGRRDRRPRRWAPRRPTPHRRHHRRAPPPERTLRASSRSSWSCTSWASRMRNTVLSALPSLSSAAGGSATSATSACSSTTTSSTTTSSTSASSAGV